MSIDKIGGAPALSSEMGPGLVGGKAQAERPFVLVLAEASREPVATGSGLTPGAPPVVRGPAEPVRKLMEGAFAMERQLDAVLEAARRGKTFSAAELLALQTQVFRYSQAVEVLSRATDKAVGAVKQTLGTQV